MPTRKQRRRRQKERRHEYEIVYVDEEGHEVEVEPEATADVARRDRRSNGKAPAKKRSTRPVRQAQPPSWSRVGRRALLFFPLIFIAFSLVNRSQALGKNIAIALIYTAFFVPFMYLMDRAMYRSYLKRTGQSLPPRASKRRQDGFAERRHGRRPSKPS
jgi:Flp pilus assembly protein TadB